MNPALPGGATGEDSLSVERWAVAARFGYTFVPYREMQQGTKTADNPNMLAVDVHLVNVQAQASLRSTTLDVQLPTGSLATSMLGASDLSTGVGDMELRIRQLARPWLRRPLLAVTAGMALPTGEYVARSGAAQLPPEAATLTLGRGVTWALAELDLQQQFGKTTAIAQLSGRRPLYRASDEFEWGAEVRLNFGARQALTSRVSATALVDLQWRGKASEPDPFAGGRLESANLGGLQFTVIPSIAWRATNEVSLGVGLRVPVYLDVFGNQLVPGAGGFVTFGYQPKLAKQDKLAKSPRAKNGVVAPRNVAGKVTVVDYWATWCTACKTVDATIAELKTQYPHVEVVKVDASAWPDDPNIVLPGEATGLPVVEVFDGSGKSSAIIKGENRQLLIDAVKKLAESSKGP